MNLNDFSKRTAACLAVAACAWLLASCVKDPNRGPDPTPADAYFGFATTRTCPVSIDYGFTNDYPVIFELYEENPLSVDETTRSMVKTTAEPLYRGSTDGKGVFADDVVLPASVGEVYLYSDYPGTVGPVKLTVGDDGKIAFDRAQLKSRAGVTRGQTGAGYAYPDRYKVLGGWSATGRPDYLLEPAQLSAQQLYDLKAAFNLAGGAHIRDYPQAERIGDDVHIRVDIKKATTIKLVFITTTASMDNAVGYYTYPTGQEPSDPSQIEPIIAFPHISTRNCNIDGTESLFTGDQVQLKYWNRERGVFEDEFPAGISIGWFVGAYMFDTRTSGLKGNTPVYYANRALNANNMHRSIAFNDNVSGRMVAIGFEDSAIKDAGDGNFCDAAFFLDYGDAGSAETGGTGTLPEAPDVTEQDNYHVVSGTLAFEDLWPSQGDYDMNDVVVNYHSTVYKNVINNRATKVVDRYTVAHIGGVFSNGFGYSMDALTPAQIARVSIASDGAPSSFMQGNMLESGQSKPTVVLFDNALDVVGQTFTVTTEFSYPVKTSQVCAPYNPFMIIQAPQGRGREVHLPKYLPTALADATYFGTGNDCSDPGQSLYYVSKENFPFAINIPGDTFKYPEEKMRIDQAYPNYTKWVSSGGKTDADWYKRPAF